MDTANAPHMPRNFDPEAYVYVGAFDAEPEPGSFFSSVGYTDWTMEDGTVVTAAHPVHATYLWLRGLLGASATSTYRDRGQCDHCGARIRYTVVLRHLPTGDHIAMGETCADSRVASMDRATWQVEALRKAAQAARKSARTRATREANLAAAPDLMEWLAAHPEGWVPRPLFDLRRANEEGQSWEPEAITLARSAAAAYDVEQARRDAERAEREANATPAPAGRQAVSGTIVSVKETEGYMPGDVTWKMLVQDARGFRVWVSIPSAVLYAEDGPAAALKGREVSFTATLEPKADDPTFAFGKRPSKATLAPIQEEVAGA